MNKLQFVFALFLATVFSPFSLIGERSSTETEKDSHQAAAETFLQLNGWWEKMEHQRHLQRDLAQQVSRASGLQGEQQETLTREIAEGLEEIWKKVDWVNIEKQMLQSIQNTYSIEELEALNAFFSTSAGEKYLVENGRLEEQTIGLVNQELAEFRPLLEKRILKVLDSSHEHEHNHEAACCSHEQ
ncbi:MAG: DUF2059 domain-containing protein [Opitutales bacterium]|nr:DUF2059 domain-containing protein [Opitutales bacterium]MCH8539850.1 hypothetical protein [Opitutales bacterium]